MMSALEDAVISRLHATETRARVGLIIPSSNRMAEAQFNRYMPAGIGVHVGRAQMTGRHKKPIAQLLDEVGHAASALGDAKCNPIVFHCTGTSMAEGTRAKPRSLRAPPRKAGRNVSRSRRRSSKRCDR
jgi:maleate cis-trans isomerase